MRNYTNLFVLIDTMDTIKKIFIANPKSDNKSDNNIIDDEIKIEIDIEENTSKKMFILTNANTTTISNSNSNPNSNSSIKNIKKKEKEKKLRVETNTWGLINEDLLFETQLELLKKINEYIKNNNASRKLFNKQQQLIISHIKSKISSYKQQDILKTKLNDEAFVSFNDVITLLFESNMKCYYCACETYLLYEIVREMKQWSLDRINNEIGHNKGNLVICCLECNLKRRRTNKDAFFFTKNLKITKENHYQDEMINEMVNEIV
jgi:uncharacterized protein YqgV (UPF0045/DUF77 family)